MSGLKCDCDLAGYVQHHRYCPVGHRIRTEKDHYCCWNCGTKLIRRDHVVLAEGKGLSDLICWSCQQERKQQKGGS